MSTLLKMVLFALLGIVALVLVAFFVYFVDHAVTARQQAQALIKLAEIENIVVEQEILEPIESIEIVTYDGPVYHIFFHSLILYPEKAITNTANAKGYNDYMVSRDQFNEILQQLYDHNFILIDSRSLYGFHGDGTPYKPELAIPAGKKPLILSIDDVSYYEYMKDGGFANRLVARNGNIFTEVITPEGETIITNDGDVMPIVDSFVRTHPDFSWQGAKGIIALTGYEGILGYDTHLEGPEGDHERELVASVVSTLKDLGWTFANHSYGHHRGYRKGTITGASLAHDIEKWEREVEPLIGDTIEFIGPFGQIFRTGDPRRQQLVDAGYPVLYGVGVHEYMRYYDDHVVMNRINIDGYSLSNFTNRLKRTLGIELENTRPLTL